MKFNCGKPLLERLSDWAIAREISRSKIEGTWQRYFCLFPRRMTEPKGECRWLEYVERKVQWKFEHGFCWVETKYRPIGEK